MPLLLAASFTVIVAMLNGWKWSVLEKGMVNSVNRTMGACLILLMVGVLVATWKAGGIIPTMIYYGLKIPALPTMFLGSVMGLFCMGVVQHIPFSEWFTVMHYGYTSISEVQLTDDYMVADIVGGCGFDAMLWTISVCFASMCFAGALECTGMLSTISGAILKRAKSRGGLVLATIATCFAMNCCTGDQYLSIIIPGRLYKKEFEDRKLKAKNLSRCLEDCATLTSPLIPWNVCGMTMTAFLGIPTIQYFKYAYLNLITPIVSIIYGYTGFTMEEMSEEEYKQMLEDRLREEEEERRTLYGE